MLRTIDFGKVEKHGTRTIFALLTSRGSLINNSRNLLRYVRTYERPMNVLPLAKLVSAYAYSLKQRLRGEDEEYSMLNLKQIAYVESSVNRPLAVSALVTDWVQKHCKNSKTRVLEVYIGTLIDCQGVLERIMLCPIPFSYVAHVHHILLLYLVTLPFCLLAEFGWYTSIAVSMISISLLGIDQAATHIEDPFGTDPSDLPLDTMCKTVFDNLSWLSDHQETVPDEDEVKSTEVELDDIGRVSSIDGLEVRISCEESAEVGTPTL